MLTWRGVVLSVGLCAGFAAACGDEPPKRSARGNDAGAAGSEATAGSGATPGASGSDGSGGEGAQARVELATYCQTIGEQYAVWLTACYGTEPYPVEKQADFAARIEERCRVAEPAVAAGRLAFDEVAAAACLAVLDTKNCDGFSFFEHEPACEGVVAGRVAVGDPCYDGPRVFAVASGECVQGAYCDMSSEACPGECVARTQDDEACDTSGECLPESWCSDGTCAPRPAIGEPCTNDACPYGSSCVAPPGETEGVCVARSQAGDACDDTSPCSFGFDCLEGECRSKVESGEPCARSLNCPEGERCLDRDGDGATCGGPGGEGVACAGANDCEAELFCDAASPQTCLPRVAIGAECTQDGQCVEGAWCNFETGECQASGGDGDSCLMHGFPAGALEACEPDLKCMDDGLCHPVGGEGDLCHPLRAETCEPGLACHTDATCQPPAEEDEPCNPYAPGSCAGDLVCRCDGPACSFNDRSPPHRCGPRRENGDVCFSTEECPVDSSCLGETEGECVPDPTPCAP